jgi:hypothetical protein
VSKVGTYTASDYAGLETDRWHFYYGYEFARDPEGEEVWGFIARYDGKSMFRISAEDMQAAVKRPLTTLDTSEMLLLGIGLFLSDDHSNDRQVGVR